jgi:hypothetical protein
MAELDYDHFDGGYSAAGSGHRFGRYAHLGGAVLSVALVISGAIWAYQLAVRDVAGVPVIRAVVDPMRLAPSNPGGSQALHQGLSVNAVAAAGTALPLPESLTLAPRPMELAEEDQAGLEPLEPVGGSDVVAMAPALAPVEPLVSQSETDAATAEALPATQEDAVAAALAEALGLESPEALLSDTAVDAPTEMAAAAAPGAEIDPATLVPGTLLVQLGAFDNQDEARQEWLRLTGTFTDLMGGKSLVIQPAQSGGKTFFRLRAHGFTTDDDTRRFCTAMLAENATCIPVVQS